MTLRRLATRCLPILAAIVFMTTGTDHAIAADPGPPNEPPSAKRTPGHARTRAATNESTAARQDRERREDLERRVERLEQQEMKPPAMPPSDPTR